MKIGVLALQGAVREHLQMLGRCGAKAVAVKWPRELGGLDGLIIPGGESTTIGKLMVRYGFDRAIQRAYAGGMAVYGTCAGLILIAKEISEGDQPLLGLMDVEARRNAFGRQVDSFEVDLKFEGIKGGDFHAVFIRAPWIERAVGPEIDILAEYDGRAVAARQGRLFVTAFHPELTDDPRIHRYFVEHVVEEVSSLGPRVSG
ncbi:MAG: pyridoxal 5'-phosphate synthase glutaminase subunit PdxT [Candidatus Aquicultorales bacterium]